MESLCLYHYVVVALDCGQRLVGVLVKRLCLACNCFYSNSKKDWRTFALIKPQNKIQKGRTDGWRKCKP